VNPEPVNAYYELMDVRIYNVYNECDVGGFDSVNSDLTTNPGNPVNSVQNRRSVHPGNI